MSSKIPDPLNPNSPFDPNDPNNPPGAVGKDDAGNFLDASGAVLKRNQPLPPLEGTTPLDLALQKAAADAKANANIIDSAVIVINGIQKQIDIAVQTALNMGATPRQLAAINAVNDAIEAATAHLASAIPSGTSAAETPAGQPSAKPLV